MKKYNISDENEIEIDRLAGTGLSDRLKELAKENKRLSLQVDEQDLVILKLKGEIKHLRSRF